MTARDRFDDSALSAAMGARPPAALNRAGRIRLIGEAATALLQDEMPRAEARLFLAGALLAWLTNGGNLERDFFRIVRPKSHVTPPVIWRQIRAHQDEGDGQ